MTMLLQRVNEIKSTNQFVPLEPAKTYEDDFVTKLNFTRELEIVLKNSDRRTKLSPLTLDIKQLM